MGLDLGAYCLNNLCYNIHVFNPILYNYHEVYLQWLI